MGDAPPVLGRTRNTTKKPPLQYGSVSSSSSSGLKGTIAFSDSSSSSRDNNNNNNNNNNNTNNMLTRTSATHDFAASTQEQQHQPLQEQHYPHQQQKRTAHSDTMTTTTTTTTTTTITTRRSGKTPSSMSRHVVMELQPDNNNNNNNNNNFGESLFRPGEEDDADAQHEEPTATAWDASSSKDHHMSTGGINPIPKRPAGKKSSGKKRRRTFAEAGAVTGRFVKKSKKPAHSSSSSSLGATDKTSNTKIGIVDDAPLRLVNPLLQCLEFPKTVGPIDISRVPNGAELHLYTDLAFHRPDTYPLAYYARVLGFAVPDHPESEEFVELDPNNVPLLSSRTPDPFFQIPPEGKYCALPSKPCNIYGDEDDQRALDYIDPVYLYLLKHNNNDKVVPAPPPVPPAISTDCIDFARQCGVISNEWTFQYWKPSTSSSSSSSHQLQESLATNWPNDRAALLEKFTPPSTGHFLILALKNNVPEAYILYQFQWFQLETELNIHKRPMSELVLKIHEIKERDRNKVAAHPPMEAFLDHDTGHNSSNTDDAHMMGESESGDEDMKPAAVTGTQRTEDNVKFGETSVMLVLTALALEHANTSSVWYALFDAPAMDVHIFETFFRMTRRLPRVENTNLGHVSLVCDLKKYSFKYAFLVKKNGLPNASSVPALSGDAANSVHDRLLVRMPTSEEVKAAISGTAGIIIRSHKRATKKLANSFSNADERQRQAGFGLRVRMSSQPGGKLHISSINENGAEVELAKIVAETPLSHDLPSFEILRSFPLTAAPQKQVTDVNEVLSELIAKQQELAGVEGSVEGELRSLLSKIVQERRMYENPAAILERSDEKRILQENEKILQRRKAMDLAWQKQLEQDMDAVCDICNDGEVTPDNQILFCEACNVAVHQICYGIEEVPVGDYYCVACRYFDRERMSDIIARLKRDPSAPKFAPSPLPICCELCPRKQGAFIQTDTSSQRPKPGESPVVLPKWVHVVCAKWQGLNFVEKSKPNVVENVTELKLTFRRLDITCSLCCGERGAFNPCRFEGCKNSLHVSCARASGMCQVIHGENAKGPVLENPWTLLCPEHSNVGPDDIPNDAVSIDQLIRSAKEFPPEPKPDPAPRKPKPFNKLSGKERAEILADPEYENELFVELLTKRLQGVRCEVCDQYEEDGKRLKRCGCGVVFCDSCSLWNIDGVDESRNFTCVACKYTAAMIESGEAYLYPRCYLCSQKGGWLREAFAAPINKISYYKNNPKEFAKTFFARQLWAHTVCVFWQYPKLSLNALTGKVDLSDVVMTHGRGFILNANRCGLCCGKGGLKAKCSHEGCRGWGEKLKPYHFHVTCAREAGLEVDCNEQDQESTFYVKCYLHGGNAFNLRARLEDLIEIEKKRSGKRLEKYIITPMSFAHASRLLNGAIWVLKTIGWAWRWAEWWVSYGSSWEPLLEEGQSEKNMTKEELRIVDSTPESRCKEARQCRLVALGAALRNRAYDVDDGFDNESLNRALRSMLHARALVGPLEDIEIDFFVEWLGRAYRSKSRLLGFGDDKIRIVPEYFCLNQENKTPKFELGERPVPGKEVLPEGEVFETPKDEVDDFLKPERLEDGSIFQVVEKSLVKKYPSVKKPKRVSMTNAKQSDSITGGDVALADPQRAVGDQVGLALETTDVLDVKPCPDLKKEQRASETERRPKRSLGLHPRNEIAVQTAEPVPNLDCAQETEQPRLDTDRVEIEEPTPVVPSMRPKRFRRSVLGGYELGNFYYGEYEMPSSSHSNNNSNRKGRVNENAVATARFTPDEDSLPLSLLLTSSNRKATHSKRDFDDSDGFGGPTSLSDAMMMQDEDSSTSTEAPPPPPRLPSRAQKKGSTVNTAEYDRYLEADINEVLALVTDSIAASKPLRKFPDSPSKRGRRLGKVKAARSILYDSPPPDSPSSYEE